MTHSRPSVSLKAIASNQERGMIMRTEINYALLTTLAISLAFWIATAPK